MLAIVNEGLTAIERAKYAIGLVVFAYINMIRLNIFAAFIGNIFLDGIGIFTDMGMIFLDSLVCDIFGGTTNGFCVNGMSTPEAIIS